MTPEEREELERLQLKQARRREVDGWWRIVVTGVMLVVTIWLLAALHWFDAVRVVLGL